MHRLHPHTPRQTTWLIRVYVCRQKVIPAPELVAGRGGAEGSVQGHLLRLPSLLRSTMGLSRSGLALAAS